MLLLPAIMALLLAAAFTMSMALARIFEIALFIGTQLLPEAILGQADLIMEYQDTSNWMNFTE